jgi:uncharacterized membrane protein YphA (DoxX/SURF4 family)
MHGIDEFATSGGAVGASWALGLMAIVIALALLIGLLTPLVAALSGLGNSMACVTLFLSSGVNDQARAICAMNLAAMSIALVLLGPGAFSLDARLFGRREIIIPEGRRPPRP